MRFADPVPDLLGGEAEAPGERLGYFEIAASAGFGEYVASSARAKIVGRESEPTDEPLYGVCVATLAGRLQRLVVPFAYVFGGEVKMVDDPLDDGLVAVEARRAQQRVVVRGAGFGFGYFVLGHDPLDEFQVAAAARGRQYLAAPSALRRGRVVSYSLGDGEVALEGLGGAEAPVGARATEKPYGRARRGIARELVGEPLRGLGAAGAARDAQRRSGKLRRYRAEVFAEPADHLRVVSPDRCQKFSPKLRGVRRLHSESFYCSHQVSGSARAGEGTHGAAYSGAPAHPIGLWRRRAPAFFSRR